MMNNLSKRLRDIALTSEPHLTTVVMDLNEAADLIDQQAAEIADLKLRLNRWNSGDNSIGAKEQVKRLKAEIERLKKVIKILDKDLYNLTEKVLPNVRDQRDEWRRRAEQQRDFMKDTLVDEEYGDQWAWDYFVQLYPEAAQWFDEKENK